MSWGFLTFSIYYLLLILYEPRAIILKHPTLLLIMISLPFLVYVFSISWRKRIFQLDRELETGELFLTLSIVPNTSFYKEKLLKREEVFLKKPITDLFLKKFPAKVLTLSIIFLLLANFVEMISGSVPIYTGGSITGEDIPYPSGEELAILDLEEWWTGDGDFILPSDFPPLEEGKGERDTEEGGETKDDKNTPSTLEEELNDTLKELAKDLKKAFKEPSKEIKENLEKLGLALEKKDYTGALAILNPLLRSLEEQGKESAGVVPGDNEGAGSVKEGSGTFGAGSGPATEAVPAKGNPSMEAPYSESEKGEGPYSPLKREGSAKKIDPVTTAEELRLFRDVVTLKLRPVSGTKEELTGGLGKVELSKAQALLYLKRVVLPPSMKALVRSYFENITP